MEIILMGGGYNFMIPDQICEGYVTSQKNVIQHTCTYVYVAWQLQVHCYLLSSFVLSCTALLTTAIQSAL